LKLLLELSRQTYVLDEGGFVRINVLLHESGDALAV
jgi:hypothetical protein